MSWSTPWLASSVLQAGQGEKAAENSSLTLPAPPHWAQARASNSKPAGPHKGPVTNCCMALRVPLMWTARSSAVPSTTLLITLG